MELYLNKIIQWIDTFFIVAAGETTVGGYIFQWMDTFLTITAGETTVNLLLPNLPPHLVTMVVGVDVSQNMVEHATRNSSHNILTYRQMDVQTVDNPRQIFPAGFSKVFL